MRRFCLLRRGILAAGALGLLALVTGPALYAWKGDAPQTVRIALVSDPHVTRNPQKTAYGQHLDAVIESVNVAAPDFVLIAGDLTDGGQPEQLDDFKKRIAAFKAPVRYVPGNHDIGDKRLASKPGAGVTDARIAQFEKKLGPTFWAETLAGVRVVGVNTSLLGSGLPEEENQWRMIETELTGARLPIVFVEHYPLFLKTADEAGGGYWNIEPIPRQRFLDLLVKGKSNIRVFLSAHLHRPLDLEWQGLRFVGTPPVSFGIPAGKQPEGWTLVTVPAAGPIETRFMAVADLPPNKSAQTMSPKSIVTESPIAASR